MKLVVVAAAAALLYVSSANADPSTSAIHEVIAAERAFAALHRTESAKAAFAATAAPDGVAVGRSGVANVQDYIATWPDRDDAGTIVWYPQFAGVAQSGDLGFTTGPALFGGGDNFGTYLTVWKRQADGGWRWMIDMGSGRDTRPEGDPDADPEILPPTGAAPIDQDEAWLALAARDDQANVALAENGGALAGFLGDDSRLTGFEPNPAIGRINWEAALAARPEGVTFGHEGGGVSQAGDLGWTFGTSRWTGESGEARGSYLRIWQHRPEGWIIVIDNSPRFPGS
jgi:ketosteroid isomerase-like protein